MNQLQVTQFLQSIAEPLHKSASVRNVYGDPIVAGDKTLIPVARIAYGFGAGGGQSGAAREVSGEGGGGGGGVAALPVGVVEISGNGTRLIRFDNPVRMAGAMAAGFLLGVLFAYRTRG